MLAEYRRSFDTFSMATSAHCCIAVTLPNVAQWQDAEDSDLWLGQDKRCSFKPADSDTTVFSFLAKMPLLYLFHEPQ